jgi:hypothetical protein
MHAAMNDEHGMKARKASDQVHGVYPPYDLQLIRATLAKETNDRGSYHEEHSYRQNEHAGHCVQSSPFVHKPCPEKSPEKKIQKENRNT